MTSRPAVPKSDTPETDAAANEIERAKLHGPDQRTLDALDITLARALAAERDFVQVHRNCIEARERAETAERQISLAQIEIKGHMRAEDELKVTVASLEHKLDDIVNTMKHAGMKVPGWIEHTDQDGRLRRDNLTIAATLMFELEAWQSRIAELEKDAARWQWWRERYCGDDASMDAINSLRGPLDTPEQLDAAVDVSRRNSVG